MPKPINKKLLSWIIAIPAIFTILTIYSFKQPFIPSMAYLIFVKYGVFSFFLLGFLYLGFIKKTVPSGLTSWQLQLESENTKGKKIKKGISILVAIPIFSAMITWAMHGYIVWPLQLYSGEEFKLQGRLIATNPLRRTMSGLTELTIKAQSNHSVSTLRWSTQKSNNYKIGDTLTLVGKRSWFGIIVDNIERKKT